MVEKNREGMLVLIRSIGIAIVVCRKKRREIFYAATSFSFLLSHLSTKAEECRKRSCFLKEKSFLPFTLHVHVCDKTSELRRNRDIRIGRSSPTSSSSPSLPLVSSGVLFFSSPRLGSKSRQEGDASRLRPRAYLSLGRNGACRRRCWNNGAQKDAFFEKLIRKYIATRRCLLGNTVSCHDR